MKNRWFPVALLLLSLLLLSKHSEAKRRTITKQKVHPIFVMEWNNLDSLQHHLQLKTEAKDWNVALRIMDTLIFRLENIGENTFAKNLEKVTLLRISGRQQEALTLLNLLRDDAFQTETFSTIELDKFVGHYLENGQKDSAFSVQNKLFGRAMRESKKVKDGMTERNDSLKIEMKKQKELSVSLIAKNKNFFYSLLSALVLLLGLLVGLGWLFVKNKKLLKRQNRQREQMIHTQTQIEKAYEEEERISADIKKMKEHVARMEVEKNQIKQSVTTNCAEILALLKTQLDDITKEFIGVIPVEKYMQLQNTITRFNAQMKRVMD